VLHTYRITAMCQLNVESKNFLSIASYDSRKAIVEQQSFRKSLKKKIPDKQIGDSGPSTLFIPKCPIDIGEMIIF
jgi:hypothetical protein